MKRIRRGSSLIVAIILIGSGTASMLWLMRHAPVPETRPHTVMVPLVAVEPVVAQRTSFPIVSYGTVRPKRQVQIVPYVSGELVFSHADLAEGNVIAEGELLFELDDAVYQARVRQAEADVSALEASLARHEQEIRDLQPRIEIAEKVLEIDKRDYETSQRLLEVDQIGTPRALDIIHQRFLQRQDALVELKSRFAAGPHIGNELRAKLDAARSRLAQAKYNLAHTKIYCPFTARVESVKAQQSQMVTAHLSIATLTDMEAFEIPVSVDPRELTWINHSVHPDRLASRQSVEDLEVGVSWSVADRRAQWAGRVERLERIDEVTRTARMIVNVGATDKAIIRAAWPAIEDIGISIGMHCRVELPSQPLEEAVLIPSHAIYDDDTVYVLQPDELDQKRGHLVQRKVNKLRTVGERMLVDFAGYNGQHKSALRQGEFLVVSRLEEPVPGMRVRLEELPLPCETQTLDERSYQAQAIPCLGT